MGVGGGGIETQILGAIVGTAVSSMLAGGKKGQPMAVESAPAAATKDNTKSAAEDASLQARKRTAGASGRSDTIKTDGLGGTGAAGPDQSKTLLGY